MKLIYLAIGLVCISLLVSGCTVEEAASEIKEDAPSETTEDPLSENYDDGLDGALADLDAWGAGTNYILKDDVQDASKGYRCIKDNFSVDPTNKPPNTEFWDEILVFPIPNTIKLVAKKIVRLIDKVPTGPGGFLRTITGVRRFEEGEQ